MILVVIWIRRAAKVETSKVTKLDFTSLQNMKGNDSNIFRAHSQQKQCWGLYSKGPPCLSLCRLAPCCSGGCSIFPFPDCLQYSPILLLIDNVKSHSAWSWSEGMGLEETQDMWKVCRGEAVRHHSRNINTQDDPAPDGLQQAIST